MDNELDEVILKLLLFNVAYKSECELEENYISKRLCPRCGVVNMPGELAMSSTSKLSPIELSFHICGECALDDKMSHEIEDFLTWAIASEDYSI